MTTIAEVRDALSDAITAGTGLRCLAYLQDTIPAPCGHLRRTEFDPRMVLGRASATYPFTLRVYVGRTAEVAAQKALDELAEPTGGICSAVEDADNWPDDLVQSAYVTSIGEPMVGTVADETFMVCDFNIEVIF
ncbi:MAG TPA: hypothetical protein VMY16_09460 [Ilumatobacteraceae bacterium]|nr:hypothetical protein [Ilumatobacteraceae bacterium]HUV18014.1 hypothetical protein [Ilumatobacteraceae bacterium]